MKYYITNDKLDAQIEEIRHKIRLMMNGIVADSMTQKGIVYPKNYGVALPDLKELAKNYQPSNDLADRLWLIGWRETLILSILLQPLENFSIDKARAEVNSIKNNETAEIICMYLLSKTDYAPTLVFELIDSDNLQTKTIGFMLAARIYSKLTEEQSEELIKQCEQHSITENYNLYKSIGLCLSRLIRINNSTANTIKLLVENFQKLETPSQYHIANEVKQELDFLK
ncbi:MAG: DNA alkylation repair protein [Paludibacter sp.]